MTTATKKFICDACGEPCNGKWHDFGIGPYEFWGQKCNDKQPAWVSDCCEVGMIDPESGSEAEPPDDPREEFDPERDGYLSEEVA